MGGSRFEFNATVVCVVRTFLKQSKDKQDNQTSNNNQSINQTKGKRRITKGNGVCILLLYVHNNETF